MSDEYNLAGNGDATRQTQGSVQGLGIRPAEWIGAGLKVIDQNALPHELSHKILATCGDVVSAIEDMTVRGAPLIGIAGAFGCALAARELAESHSQANHDAEASGAGATRALEREMLDSAFQEIATARPTAVNLKWAVERQTAVLNENGDTSVDRLYELLANEAQRILDDDIAANIGIGKHGAAEVLSRCSPEGSSKQVADRPLDDDEKTGLRIMTICNAGALATGGYGTALGVVRALHADARLSRVFACETRPRSQGARLTVWELMEDSIPVTLITDNMAAALMAKGSVDAVIVGADRIAANGDTANKIGTYGLAVLARHHDIPFFVAAPTSTIDRACPNGASIPIEERSGDEVRMVSGCYITPKDADVINPAFDVTPAELISAIVTEKGIWRPKR